MKPASFKDDSTILEQMYPESRAKNPRFFAEFWGDIDRVCSLLRPKNDVRLVTVSEHIRRQNSVKVTEQFGQEITRQEDILWSTRSRQLARLWADTICMILST